MSNALSANLVRLRKRQKLSQRAAAEKLEISQALLSHYERGIREGSIDFLLRAADFYSVSCDVLLGRSTEEAQLQALLRTDSAIESDHNLSLLTVSRAAAALSGKTQSPDAVPLTRALAVILLRVSGQQEFPAHWLNAALEELLTGAQTKKGAAECVRTVRREAKEIVRETLAEAGKN